MILYFDTTTSGRWHYGKGEPDERQPHLVRLAWILDDLAGNTIRDTCHLIRLPRDVIMPYETQSFTGIYDHQINSVGVSLTSALDEFAEALDEATLLVTFNWQHQRKVMERSYRYVIAEEGATDLRVRALLHLTARQHLCTMVDGTPVVKSPRMEPGGGFKWPTRDEFFEHVTGMEYLPTLAWQADGFTLVRSYRLMHQAVKALDQPEYPRAE